MSGDYQYRPTWVPVMDFVEARKRKCFKKQLRMRGGVTRLRKARRSGVYEEGALDKCRIRSCITYNLRGFNSSSSVHEKHPPSGTSNCELD